MGTYKDNSHTIILIEFITLIWQVLPVKMCMRDLKIGINMKTERGPARNRKGINGSEKREGEQQRVEMIGLILYVYEVIIKKRTIIYNIH